MEFERFEISAAFDFVASVIPKDVKTGKNCLFIRVDGDKFILTAGGVYSTKKAVVVAQNTTADKSKLPERFMIPRADLFAFQEMMKEHKADCKRMAKTDPSYNLVSISDDELISHDGKVTFQQPKYQFKDLEPLFDVKMDSVSTMPMMRKEMVAILTGFKDSTKIDVTYSGDGKAVHFQQGDFEAILIPPVEKEDKKKNDQKAF